MAFQAKFHDAALVQLFVVFALSISSTSYAVTVASWGGAYTESQKLGYGDPTAKKLGIPINWVDYSGGLSEIKAQKAAGKITWDIIDVFAMDTINGCDEGLFVKFDFDIKIHQIISAERRIEVSKFRTFRKR